MATERTIADGDREEVHKYSQSGQKTAGNVIRYFGPEMDLASELGSQGAGETAANVAKVQAQIQAAVQAKQEKKK